MENNVYRLNIKSDMRQLFILLLFLCSLGMYAQKEKVERKKSTSTTTQKADKQKVESQKQKAVTATQKQNGTTKSEAQKQKATSRKQGSTTTQKQNGKLKADSQKQKTQPTPAIKKCNICDKALSQCDYGGKHPYCGTCGKLKERCEYRGSHPTLNNSQGGEMAGTISL